MLLSLFSMAALSQSPTFDIADVHVSTSRAPAMSGGALRNGVYEVRHATMVELITAAYGIDADKVLGGPSWLEFDRFDVTAKAPLTTSPDNLKLMLQALLADRFKLVVHMDSKPAPAFVLSLGTGKPKLKESDGLGRSGCQSQPVAAAPGIVPVNVMSCHNITMQTFAQTLRAAGNDYLTAAVIDQTGLKGGWDVEMKWTSRGLLAPAGSAGVNLFEAVDEQLGLKLEERRVAMPVVVVDGASQKPMANPPGIATNLAAPPPVFEVAEIKPAMPGAEGPNFGLVPLSGRVDVQGATLKELILYAWDLNTDALLAGSPKSLDTNKWNIIAKASAATIGAGQVDIEELRLMLRNLLMDRFQLKTHVEDRPVMAYTLVAANPKLQRADPLGRTGCKEGPPPNPVRSRFVTCANMTMVQFADRLPSIASAYLQTPVLDKTGLDGSFDFTLNFSTIGAFQRALRGGGDGGAQAPVPSAADPSGATSLFEALTKQLGLKLDMQARPLPVLVIDHAEEKPTEN
jgi:uncharacterized protein (TIGR03435 family)